MSGRLFCLGGLALVALLVTMSAPAAAQSAPLLNGVMAKRDLDRNSSASYTFPVGEGGQVLVGALNVSSETTYRPTLTVTCPGALQPATGRSLGGAVFCTPSSNGSGTVTISTAGAQATYSYVVFAMRLEGLPQDSVDLRRIQNAQSSPDERPAGLAYRGYAFENVVSTTTTRTLAFSTGGPVDRLAFAALYRSDGALLCYQLSRVVAGGLSTVGPSSCQVYDANYNDYYLVVGNAGNGVGDSSKINFSAQLLSP